MATVGSGWCDQRTRGSTFFSQILYISFKILSLACALQSLLAPPQSNFLLQKDHSIVTQQYLQTLERSNRARATKSAEKGEREGPQHLRSDRRSQRHPAWLGEKSDREKKLHTYGQIHARMQASMQCYGSRT